MCKEIKWRYSINYRIKNNKRDIIITDRECRIRKYKNGSKNDKWYKYTCNVCGWTEGWIREDSLSEGCCCSCCSNKTAVENINSIVAKEETQWMIKYFQGGYDEAKLYTKCSGQRIIPVCPDCGRIKDKPMLISNIYKRHSINCGCSDRTSYGEKVMFNVLEQLELGFTTQLTHTVLTWCKNYLYDFYIPSLNIIIETHGEQHYIQTNRKQAKNLYEEQENDKAKKELALSNGIKEENYIVIDCRKSELGFIKNSILNSNLSKIYNLSIIDWKRVEEFALSSRIKEACDLWNKGIKPTREIGCLMKLSYPTIIRYLTKGEYIGWTTYNGREELIKGAKRQGKNGKLVEIFKGDKSLGIFKSCAELSRQSEELFDIKFNLNGIVRVCNKERSHHKGYIFRYI